MGYPARELHYLVRALGRRPLYAIVIVLVFALAIGANATVFSVFNGFFLRAMPWPQDDRLVAVYSSYPKIGLENAGTSIPAYVDRRAAPSLESLAITTPAPRTLEGTGEPESLQVAFASPSLFTVLRAAPLVGRVFTDEEATPGKDRVAVLSEPLWRARFGARHEAIGQDLRLDGVNYRIIGVMPAAFGYPDRAVDAWLPFTITPELLETNNEFSTSIGRLKPGATVAALNAELDLIARRLAERMPQVRTYLDESGYTGRARSLRELRTGDLLQMLAILQGSVLMVLLIACANVANLMLARMSARRREFAVRVTLGASRRRLAAQVLLESLLLATAGGVLGVVVALGGLKLVRALGLDRGNLGFEFPLDTTVLAFTFGLALFAALVAGLVPLLALPREELANPLRESPRTGGGRATQRFRGALVVVQIAMSVALLIGAGLLIRSFQHLEGRGPGFDVPGIWTGRVALPSARYPDDGSFARFHAQAIAALRALPGVAQAGLTSSLPVGGVNQGRYVVEGMEDRPGAAEMHAHMREIDAGFLPALALPLVAGRYFADQEPERVAIVDQRLAQRYFPDGDVLGKRLRRANDRNWATIVGVVPAVQQLSLTDRADKETIYWHYRQNAHRYGAYVMRSALPPDRLTRLATDALRRLDPDIALSDVQTMDDRVRRSLGPQRTMMVLSFVFAGVAFALAVLGIYAVLSWAVALRTGEIGVRMALGAHPGAIVRMVIAHGGRMLGLGLLLGLAGAIAIGRLLVSQIHGIGPLDPPVFAIAIAGLSAAVLLASWLPARRAARIDPMQALRTE